jgi:hypothetical protein
VGVRFVREAYSALQRQRLDGIPGAILLSAPVAWGEEEWDALVSVIARGTGVERTSITVHCSEADAQLATLAFLEDDSSYLPLGQKRTVAVFDCGGGTTDVVVRDVTRTADGLLRGPPLWNWTFPLGGDDITRRIATESVWPRLRKRLKRRTGLRQHVEAKRFLEALNGFDLYETIEFVDPGDLTAELRRVALMAAGQLKISYAALKANREADVGTLTVRLRTVDGGSHVESVKTGHCFAPRTFDGAVRSVMTPMFEELEELDRSLVDRRGHGLDLVYMAGGSSLLPTVVALAEDCFGRERVHCDPERTKTGVVLGLSALYRLNQVIMDEPGDGFSLNRGRLWGAFRRGGRVWFNDEPCVSKFMASSRLRFSSTTLLGELVAPLGTVALRSVVGEPFTSLRLTLIGSVQRPLLRVEIGGEDGQRRRWSDFGELEIELFCARNVV